MSFFRRKKHPRELRPRRVFIPPEQMKYLTTREYKIFRKRRMKKLNWYERLTKFSGKILKLNPPQDMRKELESAIKFTDLRIEPENVMSLFVLTIIAFISLGIALLSLGLAPPIGVLVVSSLGLPIGYFLYKYPTNLLKEMRIKASSEVILAILYMVVSMRISPNLERALRFAAANVSGPLAWDMRKLIWDLEMGKYYSAWDAIDDYIAKWKPENEEFAEALRLIRDSTTQTPEKTNVILDEALNVVLEGSKTRMKHYVQDLKLPIMIIHMMGIVLPVLGSIMAPLVAVFMADIARPEHFIIGYDVVLPILILWLISNTLRKRPITFSKTSVTKHPDLPKKNHVLIKGKSVPCIIFALIVLFTFVSYPVIFFYNNPEMLMVGMRGRKIEIFPLAMAGLIILGVGLSLATFFYLSTFQRKRLQEDIRSIENDFELALFQLGNRMSAGVPPEVAIEKCIDDVKDLKIADLFRMTLRNMKSLGMTFEAAFFDKRYGALLYFKSKLIKNIMHAIVDTAQRGVGYASESMFRIARYLKNIKETQEYMRELLEDTLSTMKFQAYMLTPMVTGLVVAMADIIIVVLSKLGEYVEGLGIDEFGLGNFSLAFGSVESSMSPELFQLIIGVYLIEVLIILAIFTTKISEGESKTSQWYLASKMLFVGLVLHFLIVITASTIFSDFIKEALGSLGFMEL
jgi:MFS family permease